MKTCIEMITDSLRLVNVIDGNQSPDAEQGVAGLRSLNEMMSDWAADGIRLGWYPVTDISSNVPLQDEDLRGVTFNLAVELATQYGIEPHPRVTDIAATTFARLAKRALQYFEADMTMLPLAEPYIGMSWPQE